VAATYREKNMTGPALVAVGPVDLYTCPNDGSVVRAIITNVQVTNTDAANASKVGVGVRRGAAAAAAANRFISENGMGSLAAGGYLVQDKVGIVMQPGDILYAVADVANRSTLTVNGLERLTN
jgi:hypothetical protein